MNKVKAWMRYNLLSNPIKVKDDGTFKLNLMGPFVYSQALLFIAKWIFPSLSWEIVLVPSYVILTFFAFILLWFVVCAILVLLGKGKFTITKINS